MQKIAPAKPPVVDVAAEQVSKEQRVTVRVTVRDLGGSSFVDPEKYSARPFAPGASQCLKVQSVKEHELSVRLIRLDVPQSLRSPVADGSQFPLFAFILLRSLKFESKVEFFIANEAAPGIFTIPP